jgi:putative restriction endonuclease
MRAWALISLGDDRQYGGNTGYQDDPARTYRYDSTVANHRQLGAGDLVFIRDRTSLNGVATVESVTSQPSLKVRQRCPECGSVDIKPACAGSPPPSTGPGPKSDY